MVPVDVETFVCMMDESDGTAFGDVNSGVEAEFRVSSDDVPIFSLTLRNDVGAAIVVLFV